MTLHSGTSYIITISVLIAFRWIDTSSISGWLHYIHCHYVTFNGYRIIRWNFQIPVLMNWVEYKKHKKLRNISGKMTFSISLLLLFCPCRSNAEHRGLLSEVSMVMCVGVVSDHPTILYPDVTARAIWQAVRRLGWEITRSIHARKGPTVLLPLRRKWKSGFLSPLKIHRPRSGSNPRTLGPVASTLTTSPPRTTFAFYFLKIICLNWSPCHATAFL
jgi:hypothetical protein